VNGGADQVAATPAPRGGRLFRKYVVLFFFLVSGALLTSGVVEIYFSFQESQTALLALQREKAAGAATQIEAFLGEIVRQLGGASQLGIGNAAAMDEQRRNDYLRLLRQAPAVTEISFVNSSGLESIKVSRMALNTPGSGADLSGEPKVREARARKTYFGPVYFRNDSEPFMTIAFAEAGGGVIVAEVNLKHIWDVVNRMRLGQNGYAYVVDGHGRLIAHPDISRVLKLTDLSNLTQVQAALAIGTQRADLSGVASIARDQSGSEVLTAVQPIDPPGWLVFVEQPLVEAFAPLYASVARTVLLLLLGTILAVAASLVLARRMVAPIQALQRGATLIGAGQLDQRIDIRTGDELQSLADEFNTMAARLRESYANLERRVADRTAELEEKSQQLEAANRHKSEFLASMSHELRTPLNAIIGFSDVLLERMFGELNEQQEDYLRDILASGQHLLALINDVLDLSKIEAGHMELEPSSFSLRETLESGLTMVRERAARHAIALELEMSTGLDEVEADERKVKQVVFNLLSNAVKFTPDGGRIVVSAAWDDRYVRIAVADTGVGIPAEDHERVFEEFLQSNAGPTHTREGTGLGLSLARRFVELHGGRIWLESAVGIGSTFTFEIPHRQAAAGALSTERIEVASV
jgi:signal transduction histidine kinase